MIHTNDLVCARGEKNQELPSGKKERVKWRWERKVVFLKSVCNLYVIIANCDFSSNELEKTRACRSKNKNNTKKNKNSNIAYINPESTGLLSQKKRILYLFLTRSPPLPSIPHPLPQIIRLSQTSGTLANLTAVVLLLFFMNIIYFFILNINHQILTLTLPYPFNIITILSSPHFTLLRMNIIFCITFLGYKSYSTRGIYYILNINR